MDVATTVVVENLPLENKKWSEEHGSAIKKLP